MVRRRTGRGRGRASVRVPLKVANQAAELLAEGLLPTTRSRFSRAAHTQRGDPVAFAHMQAPPQAAASSDLVWTQLGPQPGDPEANDLERRAVGAAPICPQECHGARYSQQARSPYHRSSDRHVFDRKLTGQGSSNRGSVARGQASLAHFHFCVHFRSAASAVTMRSGAALLGAIVAALSLTWVALVPVVFPGTGGSGGAVVLEGKPNARAMQAQIAAMQAETAASERAVLPHPHPHPHPRVRRGVFVRTLARLSAAVQALAGGGEPSPAALATTRTLRALRAGAPRRAPHGHAHKAHLPRVVVALEEREARDLKRAADIEHAIASALGAPSPKAVHGGGGRRVTETRAQTGSLASLAGAERRAVAALEALRRQQRAHQMMLEDEAEGEEGAEEAVMRRRGR